MTRPKKRLGRPPRKPGMDYKLRDIPEREYNEFRKLCRKRKITMREMLLTFIRTSPTLPWIPPLAPGKEEA